MHPDPFRYIPVRAYALYRTTAKAPYLELVDTYENALDAEHGAHMYLDYVDTPPTERLHVVDMLTGKVRSSFEIKRTVEIVEVPR